jgi:hypothetical protein
MVLVRADAQCWSGIHPARYNLSLHQCVSPKGRSLRHAGDASSVERKSVPVVGLPVTLWRRRAWGSITLDNAHR